MPTIEDAVAALEAKNFAAAWFERAAEQDHAEALRMLGFLYETGKGVPQDPIRAAELKSRAAALGSAW